MSDIKRRDAKLSLQIENLPAHLFPQEAFLLAGSVRENICLGEPFADDAIDAALNVAEARFVFDIPQGVDAEIGERGVTLSGGQRQRIAIARLPQLEVVGLQQPQRKPTEENKTEAHPVAVSLIGNYPL